MSDAPRSPRRPDSRQMWDESDRRQRPSDGDRERDRPRDTRPREHDDRDARPRRDRRRYRSRSRSRSRSPDRRADRDAGRGRDRRDERRRPRDERRRDEEERPDFSRGRPISTAAWRRTGELRTDAPADKPRREDRRDDRRDEDGPRPDFSRGISIMTYSWRESLAQDGVADSPQDKHRRRSASPRRSPARDDDDDAYLDTLPTRTKPDSRKSMSVRVGRADSPRESAERESPRGRSPSRDMEVDEGEVEDDDEVVVEDDGGMADMQAMMGFGGFGSTKGQKVAGNNAYAVHKEKKTVYRQYMNRTKGFNRPLSPTR